MNDQDQIASLYVACAPLAFRRARRLLNDDAEAWDVVHEVFERMARNPGALRADAHPMTYVYRGTVNACINRWKQRRVRADPRNVAGSAAHGVHGGAHGSDAFEARELLDALWDRLDDTGRAVLVMSYQDGLPQEEVADVLGIWRRTVGRRLTQIRVLALELAGRGDAPREKEMS